MSETLYNEKYRPQFHFTAKTGWLNDPNGLLYYEGEYHLFFQHNPTGTDWGNMHWGHAVSTDLVHWQQLPNAICPDELGTIFSGSGAVDEHNTTGFQTGTEKALVAAFTYAGEPFTQGIAYSIDRGRTWTKYPGNPVLPNQTGGSDRDPRILWHAPTEKWVMVLYLDQPEKRLGFFTSPDLKQWTKTSEVPDFFECPDLFELPVDGDPKNTRWILLGADGHYLIGTFDGVAFRSESGKHPADYGPNFYASQTFSNIPKADGRRIQIAWMNGGQYPDMPFNQQMGFPCELTLRTLPEGVRMCRSPVREIESLRTGEFALKGQTLKPGENPLADVSGELLDIRMTVRPEGAAEVGLRLHGQTITYAVADGAIAYLDRTAPLPAVDGRVRLRVLVDRTSLEVFGNDGQVSASFCVLPDAPGPSPELFARGGDALIEELSVHTLRSAWTSP